MENSKAINESGEVASEASQLILGCSHCLDQCGLLLRLLSQETYVATTKGTSSIGAHVRHILDRYLCLFAGMQGGFVDYDARKRDRSIESNLEAAKFALTSIARRIESLDLNEVLGSPVTVRESVYHQGPSVAAPSSVDRELMGLVSHSIHHLAIIALIAKTLGYEMDSDFGKAPSTIVYERS